MDWDFNEGVHKFAWAIILDNNYLLLKNKTAYL
jgi:hypothetical protein